LSLLDRYLAKTVMTHIFVLTAGALLPALFALLVACVAAIPSTRLAVETMPSFVHNTAARSQPAEAFDRTLQ